MQYLAAIYNDETGLIDATPEQRGALMEAYNGFGEAARAAGVLLGGEGLQPTSTATTIRVRDGERLLTDGPFAETKEQLGGFYLLECKDLDEAIEWASKIPGAQTGSIEVRPVMDYEAMQRRQRGGAAAARLSAPRAVRGRPPVPARVGAGGRHPDPRPRRLRPRRGGGPGGVRRRARALARARRARQPGRLDRDHRAQQGDRPDPPRAPRSRTSARRAGGELRALRRRRGRGAEPMSAIPDDRLRLIFTCCHPALAPEARVALTLRTLGGLTTPRDRARVPRRRGDDGAADRARQAQDPRRAASPTRCRATHDAARSGSASVLAALYLVFNEGYAATRPTRWCAATCARRRSGSRGVLAALMPDEPEALGLLALMLLQDSRRDARVDDDGRARAARGPGPHAAGTADEIDEGARAGRARAGAPAVGPYLLQAAIAAEHARAIWPRTPTGRGSSALYEPAGRGRALTRWSS